ncbi:MAG: hypothetical protein A2293_01430 [Elusimicrobia bacterium RIFOXYB2_FULL_49_7]|nr:MAG: hypothetical protein A2293_01430 [Elusimicrobia bacterium RIFOXYB2_FULL_49_7]
MQRENIRGVMLMTLSSLVFCGMGAMIKLIAYVDSYKTSLLRFMVGMAVLSTGAMAGRLHLQFVNKPLLFLRGLCGGTAVFIAFWSIAHLGMGKSTVIIYTYPIFAAMGSAFFLRERLGAAKISCIVLALLGMVLLISERSNTSIQGGEMTAVMVAIIGAVLSGSAVVMVKKLHDTDSSYAIFFAQCLIGFWLVIIPSNTAHGDLNLRACMILIGVGVTAAIGQLMMTEAYHFISVTTGSLITLVTPVGSLIIGTMVFGEMMGIRAVIGSLIIVVACSAMIWVDKNRGKINLKHRSE